MRVKGGESRQGGLQPKGGTGRKSSIFQRREMGEKGVFCGKGGRGVLVFISSFRMGGLRLIQGRVC